MVRGGEPIVAPVDNVTLPAKPFWLDNVIVVVPVEPETNDIVVGLIENPKSSTTTLRVTVPTRVSGLPAASVVA